jgi:hypothetical protein
LIVRDYNKSACLTVCALGASSSGDLYVNPKKKKGTKMNWMIIVAGFVAGFTTIGHFIIGSRQFLSPMLESQFDHVPKKVMHCAFHYVSVYLILSTAALLLVGFGVNLGGDTTVLIRFISFNYAAFALWQIAIAVTSGIPNGVFKLFQWIFFVIISVFSLLGTMN